MTDKDVIYRSYPPADMTAAEFEHFVVEMLQQTESEVDSLDIRLHEVVDGRSTRMGDGNLRPTSGTLRPGRGPSAVRSFVTSTGDCGPYRSDGARSTEDLGAVGTAQAPPAFPVGSAVGVLHIDV
jgi:hypothetical protein